MTRRGWSQQWGCGVGSRGWVSQLPPPAPESQPLPFAVGTMTVGSDALTPFKLELIICMGFYLC